MRLLDNKTQGTVAHALREHLLDAATASFLVNELSLFAWNALHPELTKLDGARLLTRASALDAAALLGGPDERHLRNALTAPHIARAFAAWLTAKSSATQVRTTSAIVPHNVYHLAPRDGAQPVALQGSSAMTAPGFGLVASERLDLNTLLEGDLTATLLTFFETLWTSHTTRDARQDLIAALTRIAEPRSPQLVYFATLYQLFRNNLTNLDENRIVNPKTGIRDTQVWKKLYRFQREGVIGVIDKLERHGGCILADSVGLGKTFEALAVIKYYELRNDRVLVLAPKKLRENWTLYTVNDKRNLLAADRFNFDVLNHTDLSRQSGKSGEIDLATLNWGNYDLIVIDESHNFRNNPQKKGALTRYARLMRDIIQSGVKTKVLMLSATPVNSRMTDLKNQVAFITEGKDDALAQDGITSIDATLRRAQARFNAWLDLPNDERTTRSLLDALDFDYFKLLDLLTIARSRKHITKYYDATEIGAFPIRQKPKNLKPDIDAAGLFPPLRDVNRDIRRLTLAAYAPLRYVLPAKRAAYDRRYDLELEDGRSFRQLDREESLVHLMRINLLKRMESSIASFSSTVDKLLAQVESIIGRLDADLGDIPDLDIEDVDFDSEDIEPFLVGTRVKVLVEDVDRIKWRQDLAVDAEILMALSHDAHRVDAARDAKLAALRDLISAKIEQPLNAGNRKVIVFTAFADTAEYLYDHLASWAQSTHGIESALVTGRSNGNRTTMAGLRIDLNAILTAFSPRSKERSKIDPDATTELDLLIATDCISEGQNLQDCDTLINYDIHWNPVRIIQRFGRIDRLGSKNTSIQLVNFWPNMQLDEYINLEARVSGRMVLLDISATGEENVIEAQARDQMNDLEYRRRQFEQLQDEVIDLEDLSNGIALTDLTLQDFRTDLGRHLQDHKTELESLPLGAYALTSAEGDLPTGVFFCLRHENPSVIHDPSYPFSPHYVIHVGDGAAISDPTQTRQVLQRMKRLALGLSAVPSDNDPTPLDLDALRLQLARAVSAITGKVDELGVASLFARGGTNVDKGASRGVDDFEVVAMLIVQEPS